jgi:hypothetical protein
MREWDALEWIGAILVGLCAVCIVGIIVLLGQMIIDRGREPQLQCVTELHSFPETNTNWVRLTCNDGSVHWEMR